MTAPTLQPHGEALHDTLKTDTMASPTCGHHGEVLRDTFEACMSKGTKAPVLMSKNISNNTGNPISAERHGFQQLNDQSTTLQQPTNINQQLVVPRHTPRTGKPDLRLCPHGRLRERYDQPHGRN